MLFLFRLMLFIMSSNYTGSIICPTPPKYDKAIQLEVGNRWVYEVIETNLATGKTIKLENEIISVLDTVSSLNNDKKGYIMASSQNYFFKRIVTDSAGYLIDLNSGYIMFSGIQLEETLYENNDQHIGMTSIDSVISVPVGTFNTANYQMKWKHSQKTINHFYANKIGLIKQVYLSKNLKKEHNLLNYSLSKSD